MTNWKKIAAGLEPPIPEADVEKITATLDGLEKAFRPLLSSIPPGEDLWSGPEEAE